MACPPIIATATRPKMAPSMAFPTARLTAMPSRSRKSPCLLAPWAPSPVSVASSSDTSGKKTTSLLANDELHSAWRQLCAPPRGRNLEANNGTRSGQISGFFLMRDYAERFGELQSDGSYTFSAARQGTIVGLLSVGALFGALVAGKMADTVGRRITISASAFFTCIGTIIEISSSHHWVQFAVGRLVSGLSIGSLSVVVPMYQGESTPAVIRGVIISSYQLLITLGIWTAEMVNWGTESKASSAAWRIPNGLSFAWALILGVGILFLPESPRYAYGKGRVDEARDTIARLSGLPPHSDGVNHQIDDIHQKLEQENESQKAFQFSEIFTGPRMMYRTTLGIVLQAGQQLTGANFFFYFGTTVFAATGISNSYTTQIILGSVNVFCTVIGLWIIKRFGRRPILMIGAAWMMMCFLVYAFVGHFALDNEDPMRTPKAGSALVTFSCLAIAAFAVSWGPLVWTVNAELYPLRYRSTCMGLATASNWLWNFLISFFTRFITDAIDYLYGLVFAGCCAALVVIVFFFVIESKDRTLEEIDTMYVRHVSAIRSGHWDTQDYRQEVRRRSEARSEAARSDGRADNNEA
ncbi:hexose transporter hxt5, variant 2 [Purpureocillium takamizusanense]|uniref:Hexose transporter hxt5, variant 2 n=1 Tax=Purpureocillium takamizusanense TaxID=2060973 RepID=A0A9Q8QUW4_9HYPO|nr:hexose transporter hxt5, variant 2 [Purpureocillium takamizusanense]UNI24937.1 hexose transporter hxt5, variant 2 [Purpureocillium takamizusanense]